MADSSPWHSLSGLSACNIATATKPQLTELMSQSLQSLPLAEAAMACGYFSDTLSTAFFFGYQCAARHLDPALASDQFAAFAASEKGIRSSRDFQTRAHQQGRFYAVSGTKSHVMLLQRQLIDAIYVLANNDESELLCLKVLTSADGFAALDAAKKQPFLQQVPHTPAVFDNCLCEPDYCIEKAHQNAFKPFRYWEDVMLSLSYAGWLIRKLSASAATMVLSASAAELVAAYYESTDYFSQRSLAAVDALVAAMTLAAKELPSCSEQEWQQDAVLLMSGAAVREKVKARLNATNKF